MKTLKEIHAEAKAYSDSEPLQDAFIAGARWAFTGKYYKPSELFDNHPVKQTMTFTMCPTFEEWWNAFGKKRGKKKAQAKWMKLSVRDRIDCMKATPAYVASTPDVTYRKDPITYLNGECWNDEILTPINYEQQRTINLASKAARILLGSDGQ